MGEMERVRYSENNTSYPIFPRFTGDSGWTKETYFIIVPLVIIKISVYTVEIFNKLLDHDHTINYKDVIGTERKTASGTCFIDTIYWSVYSCSKANIENCVIYLFFLINISGIKDSTRPFWQTYPSASIC